MMATSTIPGGGQGAMREDVLLMATSTIHGGHVSMREDVLLTATSTIHGAGHVDQERGCFTDGNIYHTLWGGSGPKKRMFY